jgi:hypothetical protein
MLNSSSAFASISSAFSFASYRQFSQEKNPADGFSQSVILTDLQKKETYN